MEHLQEVTTTDALHELCKDECAMHSLLFWMLGYLGEEKMQEILTLFGTSHTVPTL